MKKTIRAGGFAAITAFLLCLMLFAGSGAAFTVVQEAVSTPQGTLEPGEDVTASMRIVYFTGEMSSGGSLRLDTDLAGPSWTVDVIKGGTVVTTLHPSYLTKYTISGFDLSGYATDIILAITVDGTVPSDAAGQYISSIRLTETRASGIVSKTYASPAQPVAGASGVPTATPTSVPATTDTTFIITGETVTDPAGTLTPETLVKSTMRIMYLNGDTHGQSLTLGTDLSSPSWTVDIVRGGTVVTTLHPSQQTGYTISGFDLNGYESDIELVIAVEGTVSPIHTGRTVSPIRLTETGSSGDFTKTYASPGIAVLDTLVTPTVIATATPTVTATAIPTITPTATPTADPLYPEDQPNANKFRRFVRDIIAKLQSLIDRISA